MRIHAVVLSLSLLLALPAAAQTVTIGMTSFPRGETAFPNFAQCVSPAGCGGNKVLVGPPPAFNAVAPADALRGHRLDLVALEIDNKDEIRLGFPLPITNEPGDDVYMAQAEFLADLADPPGTNPVDVQVRFSETGSWHSVSRTGFARDSAAGLPTIYYTDPEIKSDAYRLWFQKLDLSNFGCAPGETVNEIRIRGGVGPTLDAVVVGNLNAAGSSENPPPVANAGSDQTVGVGVLALLDGSASSDVDGNTLTYTWSFISRPPGSAATLLDATAVQTTFTPDEPGVYVARLVVNDGTVNSASDSVMIVSSGFFTTGDAVGVYRDGTWYRDWNRNATWDGCGVDACAALGSPSGDQPVVGKW
jgi:hypothetical protein